MQECSGQVGHRGTSGRTIPKKPCVGLAGCAVLCVFHCSKPGHPSPFRLNSECLERLAPSLKRVKQCKSQVFLVPFTMDQSSSLVPIGSDGSNPSAWLVKPREKAGDPLHRGPGRNEHNKLSLLRMAWMSLSEVRYSRYPLCSHPS